MERSILIPFIFWAKDKKRKNKLFDLVLNDGQTKHIKGKDEEFGGWGPMYKEFIKLYKHKDYDKCYEYLNETLIVQEVLDKARQSAKMKF